MSNRILEARETHEILRQKCGDLLTALAVLIEQAERGNSTEYVAAVVDQRLSAVQFHAGLIVKKVTK